MRQEKYLLAIYYFEKSASRLLLENIPQDVDFAELKIDLSEFVGKGVEICSCEITDDSVEYDPEVELTVTLNVEERERTFIARDTIRVFPLIEGEPAPGIYELGENRYYEITNKLSLNAALENTYDYDFEIQKVICECDAVVINNIRDTSDDIEAVRQTLEFFDINCPLCGSKIIRYEKRSEDEPECVITEKYCPHYIGKACWSGFEFEGLENLNKNYRLDKNGLFLETGKGTWQKVIILAPSFDLKNGYWGKSGGDVDSGERFLFLE